MAYDKVLVVEDDDKLRSLVVDYLTSEGFTTIAAGDGEEAIEQCEDHHPDMVVLDWMLPKLSGLDVARRIRQRGNTPIIMVTARSEETDKLIGLELGADDYLTKPFSMRELAARIRAVLRRARPEEEVNQELSFAELTIDLTGHAVFIDQTPINLTATEFKILVLLAQNPNRVFSRLQLMDAAIGDLFEGYERTIDTHVSRLRHKLGGDKYIQTVHGVGYKFVPPRG